VETFAAHRRSVRAVELDRRKFLAGLGAGLGAASIGCGDNRAAARDAGPSGPDAAPPAPDAVVTACAASDRPASELLAGIETIVVLCLENRSFDHCLGSLRLLEGRLDIDGLVGSEWNPDADGNPVGLHLIDERLAADPPHNWGAAHRQWHGGANDGFVQAHAGAYQADVMGYRVRAQLPVTYALADAGVVCNRWFSSCLGPTWPNRAYLHAATSTGMQDNLPMLFVEPTIWDRLAAARLGGVNYYHDVPWAFGAFGKLSGIEPVERFFQDAAAGRLPPLAVIDPAFTGGTANDDHPTKDSQLSQAMVASVVAALGASPQWSRCLFVLTYDEHGGFFDHVAPPALRPGLEPFSAFDRLGFRVPTVVVGPHVRRGCAVDTAFEHGSVLSTVSRRFGLAPLNPRAAATADLSSCIDPRRLTAPLPPPRIPVVELSSQRLAALRGRAAPGHAELTAAFDARPAPPGIDRRGESDAVVRRVLRWGEQLGVVRIT
jgi:phospholipase C